MKSIVVLLSVVAVVCPSGPDAVVDIVPGVDQIGGRLELFKCNAGVTIRGTVTGLTKGLHGFHVHEKGDLGDSCKAAGGHFNPFGKNHGAPEDFVRHVGDLGNVEADSYGVAHIDISDHIISLDPSTKQYIGGLAIVIHAGVDDLGRGGNADSLKTGNAGKRSGCGLIQVVQRFVPVHPQPQQLYLPPHSAYGPPQPSLHFQQTTFGQHQQYYPNFAQFEPHFQPRFPPPRPFNAYYH